MQLEIQLYFPLRSRSFYPFYSADIEKFCITQEFVSLFEFQSYHLNVQSGLKS